MTRPRKRSRPQRLKGATTVRDRVILTNNRQVATRLGKLHHHGGGGSSSSGGGGGGGGGADDDLGRRLREAAEVIATQARENAAWSARIPPSIKVSGGSGGVSIMSDAPPAYPNEVPGVRHPVFGGPGTARPKAPWVTNQHRPFLAPAADERIDEAGEKFAQVIDDWCKERGYK
jgi:hypothetical protein